MACSPTEALRRFELDTAAESPINRRVRELHILGGLNALEMVLTQRIAEVVQVCREQGASWSEIAATLHVSKQAAHERFGHRRASNGTASNGTASTGTASTGTASTGTASRGTAAPGAALIGDPTES